MRREQRHREGNDELSSDVCILAVDDRPENLLALEAILEPLGHRIETATSGEEALRRLLTGEYAVILLDVQMPGMDGFETARIIKQRERHSFVPIIFLTAISKEEQHVFEGYSVGAVDYMFKPLDPVVLRSKVAVLVDLFQKTREVERQKEQLQLNEQRERDRAVARVREAGEQRYRNLAESMPQMVWTADADGVVEYMSEQWERYTGFPVALAAETWREVTHPLDRDRVADDWSRALRTGGVYESELRMRRADAVYRWHLSRAVAERDDAGRVTGWVGATTDIEQLRRAEELQRLLGSATSALGSSLDYRSTLQRMSELCVSELADWCGVELRAAIASGDHGAASLSASIIGDTRYGGEHANTMPPTMVACASRAGLVSAERESLTARLGSRNADSPARRVLETGSAASADDDLAVFSAPMVTRGRTLGVLTMARAADRCRYSTTERTIISDLANRAAVAVDNANLYRQAEERAQAAEVLASIGDGVILVDRAGVVRLWNPAAESILGLAREAVVGKPAASAIPGWSQLRDNVPLHSGRAAIAGSIAETLPYEINERELWLSISGVGFEQGTVYAFRDMTDEHAVERMKSDFVATVSHELRTPLAAIYGAASTLRRSDIDIDPETRDRLMEIVSDQSQRLADIVNDVLLASRVDAGHMETSVQACDPVPLVELVIAAARARAPETHTVELEVDGDVPLVAADPGQLRQVMVNLVENGIKYSPDGGVVKVCIRHEEHHLRFAVSDDGFGIAPKEQRRIFEKFYRVDAKMDTGIGGTGLGLYICRELVRQMHGRLTLESELGKGSTFFVDMPLADSGVSSNGTVTSGPQAAGVVAAPDENAS